MRDEQSNTPPEIYQSSIEWTETYYTPPYHPYWKELSPGEHLVPWQHDTRLLEESPSTRSNSPGHLPGEKEVSEETSGNVLQTKANFQVLFPIESTIDIK